jgi:hypothetical protein
LTDAGFTGMPEKQAGISPQIDKEIKKTGKKWVLEMMWYK